MNFADLVSPAVVGERSQVHLSDYARDLNIELGTRSTRDEGSRRGAWRTTGPVRAWLDPGTTMSRVAPEVDLARRAAVQAGMRRMLVVPVDPLGDFPTDRGAEKRS